MYVSTAQEKKTELPDEKLSELVREHRVLIFVDQLSGIVQGLIGQHETRLEARFLRAVAEFQRLTNESDRRKWEDLYTVFEDMRLQGFDRCDLLGAYIAYYCAYCAWKAGVLPMAQASRAAMADVLLDNCRIPNDLDRHGVQALILFLQAQLLMGPLIPSEEKESTRESDEERTGRLQKAVLAYRSSCVSRMILYDHLEKEPGSPAFRYAADLIVQAYDSFNKLFKNVAVPSQCPITPSLYKEAKERANAPFSVK